ncbi:MAG: gamma carbonic anhydrase family protein [Ignavibacteria bacterium]|jgi:carbonic anhydrase/acetyltransferase-like protein (isoleucine patch superfamily)|nr:gamma carbonic anhydrase family protein [Ignavibacteria bacterium]
MKLETGNNGSIIAYKGIYPKIHPSVFLCEGVRIIGDVEIGEDSSIWYNTVIRGDVNYIRIGKRVNVQDMTMIHVTHDTCPTILEDNVSIGHLAAIHGCTLKKGCLIGIGAKVLDGAVVGEECLVAAGAVVRENFTVPPRVLIAGVPGKIIRDLTPEEIKRVTDTTTNYMKYVSEYRKGLEDAAKM